MGPRHFSRGNWNEWFHQAFLWTCFNGATAFQPWKSLSIGQANQGQQASMGPRHFSRGNVGRLRPASFGTLSFNGATAFQPWKSSRRHFSPHPWVLLQWGYGISAVEISSITVVDLCQNWLQWGHGISAVEIASRADHTHGTPTLQWGHGISAVEIAFRASS